MDGDTVGGATNGLENCVDSAKGSSQCRHDAIRWKQRVNDEEAQPRRIGDAKLVATRDCRATMGTKSLWKLMTEYRWVYRDIFLRWADFHHVGVVIGKTGGVDTNSGAYGPIPWHTDVVNCSAVVSAMRQY